MKQGRSIILMGVSGTGKTSVGNEIARRLGWKMIDGDDLHPKANILKMAQGTPLNDEDRMPWLERIRDAAFSLEQKNEIGIIVCSALKKRYRDFLREGNERLQFLHLHGEMALILERMQQRQGHFMKAEMLKSQFDTLEMPQADEPDVLNVSIEGDLNAVVERAIAALKGSAPSEFDSQG